MLVKLLKIIRKNIIFAWLLSYLVIALFPMICNGIIYTHAKKAIKNELAINSTQAMDKFKMSVDSIFIDISNTARTLQSDKSISRLYNKPYGTPYSECIEDSLSVTKKLQDVLRSSPSLSEIYVYYRNIDLVTGSHYMYTKKTFYDQNFKDSDLTYDDWSSMFEENCYGVPKLISYPDRNRQTVDIYYQIPAFLDEFDAMAVFSIDTATLLNDAKTVTDLYSDVGIFILSKDGEIIMTNGVVDSIPESSRNCTVIRTVSDTIGWQYVSVIPSKVFNKKLTYFKWINIFNIIICLILCGILSYFFAKMNARPFSKLKRIYNDESENETDIALINNVLDDYRSAKQTQSELEQARLMEELISTGQPKILEELKKHNIDFPYQFFCVILFKLTNVSQLFEDENDISSVQRYDAVKLIIKNVLEEIINEKHYAHICKINGQIVAVVNINHDHILDFRDDIENMLNRGQEFVSSRFAFSFTPFVGGIHDVTALQQSYLEALKILQYRTFIPTSEIVFCDDLNTENDTSNASAIIPAEKKKQLINLLQLGDAQTSLSMVDSLLLEAPQNSPIKYRVFLFDLISTIICAVESVDKDDVEIKLSDELCSLAGSSDLSVILEKINEIITELCRHRLNDNAGKRNIDGSFSKKDIVSEIKKFISENYTNQTLNISMIGEYFNITPYYASNIFKKIENISMLDFISAMRVEKAKELLVNTDLNIEAVALQSGFSNVRTFMRSFQKFEVITPGKYKELNKK